MHKCESQGLGGPWSPQLDSLIQLFPSFPCPIPKAPVIELCEVGDVLRAVGIFLT